MRLDANRRCALEATDQPERRRPASVPRLRASLELRVDRECRCAESAAISYENAKHLHNLTPVPKSSRNQHRDDRLLTGFDKLRIDRFRIALAAKHRYVAAVDREVEPVFIPSCEPKRHWSYVTPAFAIPDTATAWRFRSTHLHPGPHQVLAGVRRGSCA